jgi:galactokinase
MRSFVDEFGCHALTAAEAPGRVNLLGEHTDYNDGFVLPIGIKQRTRVEVAPSSDGRFHVYAADLNERVSIVPGSAANEGFGRYIGGCLAMLAASGYAIPPLLIRVSSTVPIGVGLSSSAALEVAMLRALRDLLEINMDDTTLALMAQQAEIRYAAVRCGILDQMASSLGDENTMLFLDTRSLAYQRLPLPPDSEILVIDTGTPRVLSGTAYNDRRTECEAAARALGVAALRDVDSPEALASLPEPLRSRARHVVTENRRVLDALNADADAFGELMNASHASLRLDFAVSTPALDALSAALRSDPLVYGARLTGAGFGGACVALVQKGAVSSAAANALRKYQAAGFDKGSVLV